jgi:hypothetical protein
MIRALPLLPLSLVALALCPFEELRFAPRQGATLRTTCEGEAHLELVSMEMTVDGAAHGGMPVPEVSLEWRSELVFLDRHEEVDEGRVTRLERTYEALAETTDRSISAHEGDEQETLEAESDLEGRTVLFTWDADDEEYATAFEGDEGDSDLLEGLAARIDLADFLPEDEVAEGDEWEVPVEAMRAVLEPGGDLQLVSEEEGEGGPDTDLGEELDGSVRATLRGSREEDGRTLAVIGLEVEVEGVEERPLADGTGEETSEQEFDLSGELTWDGEAGRLHALELTGELRLRVVTRRDVDMGDQSFEVVQASELAGECALRMRVEPQ